MKKIIAGLALTFGLASSASAVTVTYQIQYSGFDAKWDSTSKLVVDTKDILSAKAPDFKLQPRDIVYVGRNPWVAAGEVLDMAAKAFVQSLIVQGTTLRIPPAIK